MDKQEELGMWDAIHQSFNNGLGLKAEAAAFLYEAHEELRKEYYSAQEKLREPVPDPVEVHPLFEGDEDTVTFNISMTGKFAPVEVKTIGQLIDELCIENSKIFALVDKVKEGGDTYLQDQIQEHNDIRRSLVRALDRRLGERDIGGRA